MKRVLEGESGYETVTLYHCQSNHEEECQL